ELIRKTLAKYPDVRENWSTLGIANYRAGNWKGAAEALSRAAECHSDYGHYHAEGYWHPGLGFGEAGVWFFRAMTSWRLGEKAGAREWYAQGLRWMAYNKEAMAKNWVQAEQLRRFRAEAAELLGIKDEKK